MKRVVSAAVAAVLALCTHTAEADQVPAQTAGDGARYVPPPDVHYQAASSGYYPSGAWILTQLLLPSPELAVGVVHHTDVAGVRETTHPTAFGLRWQATPVLWSWGVNRRVSPWRFLVVDPIARNSGSLELNVAVEYLWGDIDRFIVRPGIRANFPLVERGEYLSCAIGTSIYQYDGVPRVAYDAGIYTLYGILGAQVTIAPNHLPMAGIATLRIRYF